MPEAANEDISNASKVMSDQNGINLDLKKENSELLEQRNELLEALKEMLRHTDGNCSEEPTTTLSQAEENAKKAIFKKHW